MSSLKTGKYPKKFAIELFESLLHDLSGKVEENGAFSFSNLTFLLLTCGLEFTLKLHRTVKPAATKLQYLLIKRNPF